MKIKPYRNRHSNGELEQGYSFYCPACHDRHWLRTVAPQLTKRNDGSDWPTWVFNGSHDCPSFRPSLLYYVIPGHYEGDTWVTTGPKKIQCHSQIIDGQIKFFEDNPHALSGQTVDLPDLPPEVLH